MREVVYLDDGSRDGMFFFCTELRWQAMFDRQGWAITPLSTSIKSRDSGSEAEQMKGSRLWLDIRASYWQ